MEDLFLQDNLSMIEQSIWEMLGRGVNSFKAPFHQGVVATVYHNHPELRTVVLRDVETSMRMLRFHTDIRSAKILQLNNNNQICFLFYDSDLRIQLRCSGIATVHHLDAIAEKAWKKSRLPSQLCYTNLLPPGSVLSEPLLIDLNRKEVEEGELVLAYENFAVVNTEINKIDWVYLHHKGHRRAIFDYHLNAFHWVQP
jgi:hypothetical protein